MTQLAWAPAAEDDLEAIEDYIAADNPRAAIDVSERISAQARMLAQHPQAGRRGRVRGTRELVIAGLPYILVYRTSPGLIEIARVLHGAQQWPPASS